MLSAEWQSGVKGLICPIYKKVDREKTENYRGITAKYELQMVSGGTGRYAEKKMERKQREYKKYIWNGH